MEHSKKAKLSSQQVLGIFLSLPPQCGDYKQAPNPADVTQCKGRQQERMSYTGMEKAVLKF